MTVTNELQSDLSTVHDKLVETLTKAYALAKLDDALTTEYYMLWAELTRDPEFRPGRSNAERDIKMRAAVPDFMETWDQHQLTMKEAKFELELARIHWQLVQSRVALVSVAY